MKLTENHATVFALDQKRSPSYAKLAFLMSRGHKFDKNTGGVTLGATDVTAYKALKAIHQDGYSHICGWNKSGTLYVPQYAWGPGEDVPRPVSKYSVYKRKAPEREQAKKRKKVALAENQIFNLIVGK